MTSHENNSEQDLNGDQANTEHRHHIVVKCPGGQVMIATDCKDQETVSCILNRLIPFVESRTMLEMLGLPHLQKRSRLSKVPGVLRSQWPDSEQYGVADLCHLQQ